jgi:glycosyltransferase involved in cell wall biosynthesis
MKLSVLIITYNHERFIVQAIESVLAQKVNFAYEIVIGEDCSTDGTRAIVMDFQQRFPERIKLLPTERNIGAMRNLERTIAACRGQYLAFLEGDDYWTSADKLQRQIDFLDAHPDRAICCHRVRFLYETGSEDFDVKFDVFPPSAAGPYTIEDVLKGNFVMTCSMVLRRELIGRFPAWFFEMKLGDWPLCALVSRHGRVELMDEVMATYRLHRGCTWSSLPQVTRLRETVRMLKALDKELHHRHADAIREATTRPYLDLAATARSQNSRTETAKYLVTCIRNGGLRLPGMLPAFASLAAYVLLGSWYKIFSRPSKPSRPDPHSVQGAR